MQFMYSRWLLSSDISGWFVLAASMPVVLGRRSLAWATGYSCTSQSRYCYGYGDLLHAAVETARKYGFAAVVSHLCNNPACNNITCLALELDGVAKLRHCWGVRRAPGEMVGGLEGVRTNLALSCWIT